MLTAIEYAILDVAEANPSDHLTGDRITEYAMVRRYPATREMYGSALVVLRNLGYMAGRGYGSVEITEKGRAALLEARTEVSRM
jgi:hypothetical protein